jgi:hypothetical protein
MNEITIPVPLQSSTACRERFLLILMHEGQDEGFHMPLKSVDYPGYTVY